MRALERIRSVGRVLQALAPPRRPRTFTCGDCERWQRCGLPPDTSCAARAEQLARNGGRPPSRTALSELTSWGY